MIQAFSLVGIKKIPVLTSIWATNPRNSCMIQLNVMGIKMGTRKGVNEPPRMCEEERKKVPTH